MRCVIDQTAIAARVAALGRDISRDYRGRDLLLVGVLKGAFVFLADLVRAISLAVEVDFVRVASYGHATTSSGTCTLTKDLESDPAGRDVLLVEDIADSGRTLAFLVERLRARGARSVAVCVLIDKTGRRERRLDLAYTGFTVASGFLVGYGLDHGERYRHLPAVYALDAGEEGDPGPGRPALQDRDG